MVYQGTLVTSQISWPHLCTKGRQGILMTTGNDQGRLGHLSHSEGSQDCQEPDILAGAPH